MKTGVLNISFFAACSVARHFIKALKPQAPSTGVRRTPVILAGSAALLLSFMFFSFTSTILHALLQRETSSYVIFTDDVNEEQLQQNPAIFNNQ